MQQLRYGLGYMMNRQLGLGWNVWLEFWQEELHKKRRWARRWGTWPTASCRRGERVARLVAMRKLQRGALTRMRNRQLSGGWNAWVEFEEEELRKREAIRRPDPRRQARAVEGWNGGRDVAGVSATGHLCGA